MYTAGARGERISKSDKLAVGLRRKKCVVRVGLADTTTTNKQTKKKKSLQHLVFPGGHPSKY